MNHKIIFYAAISGYISTWKGPCHHQRTIWWIHIQVKPRPSEYIHVNINTQLTCEVICQQERLSRSLSDTAALSLKSSQSCWPRHHWPCVYFDWIFSTTTLPSLEWWQYWLYVQRVKTAHFKWIARQSLHNKVSLQVFSESYCIMWKKRIVKPVVAPEEAACYLIKCLQWRHYNAVKC